MKPKTRKTLIVGVAASIFGPVLGWVLTIAGFFKTEQSLLQTPPGTIPDMGQTMSNMLFNLIPILVGALCGAVGLFLVLYALIIHFFSGQKTDVQKFFQKTLTPRPFDEENPFSQNE
jgi:hypothetical protein